MKKPKFEKVRVENMAKDIYDTGGKGAFEISLEERRKKLNDRIERFLKTLTRVQRREVKKHMKAGMELEDALKAIGWQINKTPKQKDA